MKLLSKIISLVSLSVLFASLTYGATVTGTVKGTDGVPYMGAFVQANNVKANMMMSVLTNGKGQYKLENLPAGEYIIQIHAVGYKADPRTAVNLSADQKTSFDFALQPGVVHWIDLSTVQAEALLPDGPSKEVKADVMKSCWQGCHSFQHVFASYRLDEAGWREKVNFMKWAQFSFGQVGSGRMDHQFDEAVQYLSTVFSPDSTLPDSPADIPGYKDTIKKFNEEAMNMVYVEYSTLGGNPPLTRHRDPWSAWYDEKRSQVIVPYISGNGFGRMDLKTGKVEEYWLTPPAEYTAKAGEVIFHSASVAPDGTIWFTEAGAKKLGKWDPNTKQFTEYPDPAGIHSVRVDSKGTIWTSGAFSSFDPETEKFTRYPETKGAYQILVDKNDNPWFTSPGASQIGYVTAKTGKLNIFTYSDDKMHPHRLTVAPDGTAWFNGSEDKIVRFDPKTEQFTDFPIPGPNVGTYGMGNDSNGYIWYNSEWHDVLGRIDPKSGKVIEYPFPQSENGIKELLPDTHNRVWFASPRNDKFGYYYLAGKTDRPMN